MVDQHVLASRLSALESYRAKLESFKRFSREEFLQDEDVHELAADQDVSEAHPAFEALGERGFENTLFPTSTWLPTTSEPTRRSTTSSGLDEFSKRMAGFLTE